MPIDNCLITFEEIVSKKLPAYFAELKKRLTHPISAAEFGKPNFGVVRLATKYAPNKKDFHGCYVCLDETKPVYVGISKNVIKRIRDHVTAKHHFTSSFVHQIAKRDSDIAKYKNDIKHEEYIRLFLAARLKLTKWNVAFIEIACPVELYLFEVYAAMKLDTAEFNTFKTH